MAMSVKRSVLPAQLDKGDDDDDEYDYNLNIKRF